MIMKINVNRDEEMQINLAATRNYATIYGGPSIITQIAHVEALFYIIVLMFTLITLVLAVVLRESPQL